MGWQLCMGGNFKTGMVNHTGHKSFVCGLCKRRFYHSWFLESAQEVSHWSWTLCLWCVRQGFTHTGHKHFVRDMCSKACTKACNLTVHKRSHTSQKPLVCDVCGNAFSFPMPVTCMCTRGPILVKNPKLVMSAVRLLLWLVT